MDNADLLQQCRSYFPGLTWHVDDGYEKAFAHCFLGRTLRFDFSLTWNGESYGLTIHVERQILLASFTGITPASALAQAAALWREFAAEAGAVAGPGWMAEPGPECAVSTPMLRTNVGAAYRPSPEIQQQSDMGLAAHLIEGDRRRAQGLPPDRQAQAEAAARAMEYTLEKERHRKP